MTVVNWSLQRHQVVVVTDTLLSEHRTGSAAAFVQKAHPVPHLETIISGRGDGGLITAWASYAATRVIARDYDVLAEIAPDLIRQLRAQQLADGSPYDGTCSIFMWGWSPSAGRFVGHVFRSGNDYAAGSLPDGVGCAPGFEDPCDDLIAALQGENVPQALFDALLQQNRETRRNPDKVHRNNCGGDAMLSMMTVAEDGAVVSTTRRLMRFAEYDADYDEALTLAGL